MFKAAHFSMFGRSPQAAPSLGAWRILPCFRRSNPQRKTPMKTQLLVRSFRAFSAGLLAATALCPGVQGAIRIVSKDTDNNPADAANAGELRREINLASPGDTIVFDAAFFSTPRTILLHPELYGGLYIGKNLTIIGPGPTNLVVDAGGIYNRVFTIGAVTASISGLTITGGKAPQEGANPILFIPPQYTRGGGVYSAGATLTLSNCWIVNNQAVKGPLYQVTASGGGVYSERGVLTVVDCLISNNVAQAVANAGYLASGGGIYASPPASPGGPALTLLRSTVSGNRAAGSGASGGGVTVAAGVGGTPPSSIFN